MPKVKINGISVDIPFEPYPSQSITIAKLLECFQTNTNALIESPTGTGKSLSIICSVLAYNEQMKRDRKPDQKPFKIFICSRTHKQLDQLIEQLRKTEYRPRITILGSRNQYCINNSISGVVDKNKACSDLIKEGKCVYFNRKEKLMKRIGEKIFDIEELKAEGRKCSGCPYFTARALQPDADIVFCPYNYLVETSIREASEIKLDNAIILIDEAHNIEDCCRSAGSTEITSKLLDIIISEIMSGVKKSALLGEVQNDFINLMEIFRKFREYSSVSAFDSKGFDSSSIVRKGKQIVAELEKMGITKERFLVFKDSLHNISKNDDSKDILDLNTVRFLKDIERIIGMVMFSGTDAYAYCFIKYIGNQGRNAISYSYNFWLLDPSIMFLPVVSKTKAVALLSGTLTPFSSFTQELKFAFQHKLEAPHILRDEQVFVCNIRKGHLKKDLCGTYNISETLEYLDQIARFVTVVAEQVKNHGGTLVFVPNYSFLFKLAGRIKDAIVESKDGGMVDFEKKIAAYRARISQKNPAIFLCVYRGKAAEGVDFRDEFARAVVAVGIPYPSIKDKQIELKKEYNDKNGGYNGRLWYEAQAFRAVNQALGRAIRHSNDWGSVFLLDSRYSEKRYHSSLPGWINKSIKFYETYDDCAEKFKNFVDFHSKK